MPRRRLVDLLLRKASQDEYMLDLAMADENAPLEPFGFHAQQAAEKLLKATIKAAGSDFPLTHRLDELLDIAREAGADVPQRFEELRELTPFAVEFRYDVCPTEPGPQLDRRACRALIRELRAWVEEFAASRGLQESDG